MHLSKNGSFLEQNHTLKKFVSSDYCVEIDVGGRNFQWPPPQPRNYVETASNVLNALYLPPKQEKVVVVKLVNVV